MTHWQVRMQQLQLLKLCSSAFVKVYNAVSLHYFHPVQITAAHTFLLIKVI